MQPATLIIEPSRSMKPRLGLFLKRVNEKAVKTSEQKTSDYSFYDDILRWEVCAIH